MSLEQCSLDCAPGVKVIPCQAITARAALVANPAVDHIQVGSSDVQGLQHVHFMIVHSGLPTAELWNVCAMRLSIRLSSRC